MRSDVGTADRAPVAWRALPGRLRFQTKLYLAFSAILGLVMPIALRMLRLEPRVAAGPIALAGADVITILLYLNLARWLLA